jgi:predicted alpha/beta superfamily hydrolase
VPVNAAPTAINLAIIDSNGVHALPGDTLYSVYEYADSDGDTEGASRINWLHNDEIISGATENNYTLVPGDDDQMVSFRVTPVAASGTAEGPQASSAGLAIGYLTGSRLAAQEFYSTSTDWTYLIHVYLPAGYDATSIEYPVMYQLDGQSRFTPGADVLDEKAKKLVLVSIATVPARRPIDYLLPGTYDFYNFLTVELIPFIESRYRIDQNNRTLMGHSLGGSFTGVALLIDQPERNYFKSYIVSDAVFREDQAIQIIAMEQQLSTLAESLPVDLIIGTGLRGNVVSNSGFNALFVDSAYADLNRHYFEFDATHEETFFLTFRRAVDVLFPDATID